MSRFPDHNDWVRSFYVSNPTLHKKGYTVYKVVSKVFPKNSVEAASQVIVWKRYSDFSKLYKALLLIYQGLHLKGNFPKFAKAQFFGRFEEDVIEERRQSALHLLEFAAKYPVLFNSQVFVKFFERSEEVNDEPEPEMSRLDPPLLAPPAGSPSKFNGISAEAYTKLPEVSSMGAGDSLSERPVSHRITAFDQLSLDSRTTEEETDTSVRSTTTEGEDDNVCNAMRPPRGFSFSDLAMFDPILQSQGSEKEDCPSLSNAWILSAVGMCANLAEEAGSPPGCAFSFPKPFQDLSPNDDDDDEWLRLQEGALLVPGCPTWSGCPSRKLYRTHGACTIVSTLSGLACTVVKRNRKSVGQESETQFSVTRRAWDNQKKKKNKKQKGKLRSFALKWYLRVKYVHCKLSWITDTTSGIDEYVQLS
uniref:Putative ribosomal protein s6 kinase n=1 Tax=Ixodes ricinus TaxID=34613 RepID=A0A090X8A5_IXORI